MKKKLTVLSLIAVLAAGAAFAQKAISDGTLSYNIAIQSEGTTATNASLTVYLKGLASRTDMASNLGSEKTVYDAKTGTGVILKEYSGQKLMITLTKENWQEKNKKSEGVSFTDQAGNKDILNYSCSKATAKLNDGSTLTVFYTKDITVQNKEYNPLFKNLNGLPMQYEVQSGKMKFTYTIEKIDQAGVPQSKFDLPKTGYRTISYDDNKQGSKQ